MRSIPYNSHTKVFIIIVYLIARELIHSNEHWNGITDFKNDTEKETISSDDLIVIFNFQ